MLPSPRRVSPLLAVARECLASAPGAAAAAAAAAANSTLRFSSSPTPPPLPPKSAASATAPPPRPRPATSLSRSRFSEKRGKVHGSPYKQEKGVLSPPRAVPSSIPRPPYALGLGVPATYPQPPVHDARGQDRMRKASAIASEVLARAGESVRAGVTTDELDSVVHALTLGLGAYPSPLGYCGFPKSVCSSVNEVVCHGIPDSTVLRDGDIVKLDVSCFVGGVHGDTCRTFVVGGEAALDDDGRRLVATTRGALDGAIALCGPGVPIRSIGAYIDSVLERERFEGVRAFAGHGIGEVFHTEPIVNHHTNGSKYVMREGMTFTIEPMVAEGTGDVLQWQDGWTIVTTDAGRSAQFEHTLLVTANGVEVLTRY
jgi:methionyl aminopeptidase